MSVFGCPLSRAQPQPSSRSNVVALATEDNLRDLIVSPRSGVHQWAARLRKIITAETAEGAEKIGVNDPPEQLCDLRVLCGEQCTTPASWLGLPPHTAVRRSTRFRSASGYRSMAYRTVVRGTREPCASKKAVSRFRSVRPASRNIHPVAL